LRRRFGQLVRARLRSARVSSVAMASLTLLALLIAGGWAYVHWAADWVAQGVSTWWFVLAAPFAYFAPVLLLVSIWFGLAWIWRTPRAPDAQLDFAGSVRLFAGEVLAVAISWPLIALHRLFIRDVAPADARLHVVLVHGVLVNDGVWFAVRRHLARQGGIAVHTINYGPPHADIEHFADQLAAKVDAVCRRVQIAQVTLVCHSMGGLVGRAYVRRYGRARVERIITIGAPHHGSVLACTFPGRCLAQMRPGNAWLAGLNRDEASPYPVPITSIWSRHDSMVAPQASSDLARAENIALVGLGHNALLADADVLELVWSSLAKGPSTTSPLR
jgi:pimeloyl-ACP methyl ester carboxylesterase